MNKSMTDTVEEIQPRVLPCGHTVSEEFLQSRVQYCGINCIECPACHRISETPKYGVAGFPINCNVEDVWQTHSELNHLHGLDSTRQKNTNRKYHEKWNSDPRAKTSEHLTFSNHEHPTLKWHHPYDELRDSGFKLISPKNGKHGRSSSRIHFPQNFAKIHHPGLHISTRKASLQPTQQLEADRRKSVKYHPANWNEQSGFVGQKNLSSRYGRFHDMVHSSSAELTFHPAYKLLTEKHQSISSDLLEVIEPHFNDANIHSESLKQHQEIHPEGDFTVSLSVNKIKETNVNYYSRDHVIHNLPWRLGVRREGKSSSLGIYLYLNRGVDNIVSCTADRKIKLVHAMDERSSIANIVKGDVYRPGGDGRGWWDFIRWDELLNPLSGFISNGQLTIKTTVKVIDLKKTLT